MLFSSETGLTNRSYHHVLETKLVATRGITSGQIVSIEGWGWIGRKKSVSKIEQLTGGVGRVVSVVA